MRLRERLRQHRKDRRLIVGALAGLLFLLTGFFYVLQRARDLPSALVANRVLLFVLWYINVVLILAVLFVLLRNVFKLVLERHHRILGSTFKLKLVATYIGLSLIPVLLLFAIASELLQGSIDRWFNTPLQPSLERGSAVAQALYDRILQSNRRDAARVMSEILPFDLHNPDQRPRFNHRLEELLSELRLEVLVVYEGTDFVGGVIDLKSGLRDLPEPRRAFLEEAAAEGDATLVDTPAGGRGKLFWAAIANNPTGPPAPNAPIRAGPESENHAPIIVVAGSLMEPVLADRSRRLIDDFQSYRQLVVQKDDIRASHLLSFLMVTLLILLASSWVGLYLARRVTVPIQALAEGTRRISGGDLDHRVDVEADDELGVLVDSFNRMTDELANSKALLERGNRDLVASNERLAEARARIGAVLENLAAGVVSIDPQARIFTCNSAALRMLRQSEGEVIGQPVSSAWADSERAKLATLVADPRRGSAGKEVHLILGGEWKTFEAKITVLPGPPGEPSGKVLVLEDLTALIKAQQLAAWNEAARRIAHEIKNPLTPIRLAAERMLKKHREAESGLGRAIEDGVEVIVREVTTLQGMVDEFSRYARMPRPQPTKIELARLVDETLRLYQGLKAGVEVAGSTNGDPREVLLDGEQIKRALINLLDNAVEATTAPGRVSVATRAVNGHLEIEVADTGRGIPPDAKEKLFLPYFSTKGRGTGLGLAIVHRIVTDHHGSIRVEDNQPQGTVFILELPLG
jgi:two-component system nitrogen regulation sensor histidine kinase NtrY